MDSDDSKLEKLLNQCKSNDVDVKVDALVKMQNAFEAGIEINEPDGVISIFKTSVRTANQHLTNAALAALPPLLPLLITRSLHNVRHTPYSVSSSTSSVSSSEYVDAATLRQVMNAFLPAGGLIERLGDKERTQVKAREVLVRLGGYAYKAGGGSTISTRSTRDKGPETPLMMFERFLREGGLMSKIWKVREQSILVLVHIRRVHHQFPIRPYLSNLVDCLEDGDAHVRDCARQSVVEIFSGPGVTDAARSDLKKEMMKKGVRKAIVEDVLSKLLNASVASSGHSRNGSETDGTSRSKATKEYIPPSIALQARKPSANLPGSDLSRTTSHSSSKESSRPPSRPPSRVATPSAIVSPTSESADVHPVYIASSKDLETEFAAMAKPFEGKESEHNWAAREQGILRVRGMLKGDVHLRYTDTFLSCLKEGFVQWSLKALVSLRTTVALNTSCLYSELAVALGPSLDPHCDTLLMNLLKMAGFTKKITAQQSQTTVSTILTYTSAQPRTVIPLLSQTLQEKTVQTRTYAISHIRVYLEAHGSRSKQNIEASGGLDILEKCIKRALGDANPAVKESTRKVFWTFHEIWPERGTVILDSLDATARRQVEKVCPRPEMLSTPPPMTPKTTKKSSVAAAIAASRAKAKAIATAPPTLRHQATSASHASLRRAISPTSSTPSAAVRPSSPLRFSTSPPSPRARVASNSVPRSVSYTSELSSRHVRSPSDGSSPTNSPPSPRRRTSSPLIPNSPPARPSTVRNLVQLNARTPSLGQGLLPSRSANGADRRSLERQSFNVANVLDGKDESLLLAQTVPLPEDSDSDGEAAGNLISFTSALETHTSPSIRMPAVPRTSSPKSSTSKPTLELSMTLSSDSGMDINSVTQPIVEDALRARAEQAESAAERLLELVEPEEASPQQSSIPSSLLVSSHTGSNMARTKPKPAPLPIQNPQPPSTPVNKKTLIMRQAAMFRDSPAQNKGSTSLMDVLQGRKQETGWWLKRQTLLSRAQTLRAGTESSRQEVQHYIAILEAGNPDVETLQNLALFCMRYPAVNASSPSLSTGSFRLGSPSPFSGSSQTIPSFKITVWEEDKTFDRLFSALMEILHSSQSEEVLEYGLIVVWEILDSQSPYIEGKEADLFSALLRIRYCNKLNVLEATNMIRDCLTSSIDPVYGLITLHASLKTFHVEDPPASSDDSVKSTTYAFGLIALGKFILRLPAEIAEEELPRLRATLISALNDKSSLIIRESAAASIIAAQLVLRDETHLFALLDGLADDKKNLLAYLFDKHGVRGSADSTRPSGMDKLEKEIRRLDTRTSTPSKPLRAP